MALLLWALPAAPAGASGARGLSSVALKRLGAAPIAGARVRLQVRARVRRGRVIRRHTVGFGDGTRLRRGVRRPRELRHIYRRAGRYRLTLTLIDNRRRRTVGRLWVAVRSAPAPAPAPPPEVAPAPIAPAPPPSERLTVPSSIPADCSVPVQEQLASFIDAQPDGSTIEFPAGGCYAQSDRILLRDKHNLTIDANGSSFMSSAPNRGDRIAGNWIILRGTNVRLTDMRIVGNFHLTGARSQERVNEATSGPIGSQFNMGVGIYGGTAIHVTDTTIEHVFGDGVAVNMAHYVDGSAAHPLDAPSDVHVERVHTHKAARHCYAPSATDGFWLEDSTASDCWYGGLDAELDSPSQELKDLHILRNRFDGFFMFGIIFPVAGDGDNTENVEIRDNTFATRPDNECNVTIGIGLYPKSPNTIKNVVVAGNALAARSGFGVRFDHVDGGAITDNRAAGYLEAGCSYPAATPFSLLTNSTGVTVAANDPLP
jgi:hypothetical protein